MPAKKDELHLTADKKINSNSDVSSSTSGEENEERGNWSRKMDFVLSCLSYAVGLGNVWRFPYVCYRNGAGAFLIPYVVMLFITGIPLVYLELSFGQFGSSGVVSIWKASPLFQGVGWAMFIVSVLIAIYYNMIIAYTLYYLFASFQAVLPWSFCGDWSTAACSEKKVEAVDCTNRNGTWCNHHCYIENDVNATVWASVVNCTDIQSEKLRSPSDEYFYKSVLDISDNIQEMGGLRWQLVLCLLLAWVLVALCLAKGIKSSGKAVYFTAFFPYIVLLILLIRSLTLEGSVEGIKYYFKPQWERLLTAKVWGDAAVQIFFSLSPCWGGLITLSSYNKFHNNCFLDAVFVSIADSLTSVFAGLVIFSIIGYMAAEMKVGIDEVVVGGAGLAFTVYPEVVKKLPISQLWSVLFFLMLVTLGFGTQIATVTTVNTTLQDQFPAMFRKNQKRKLALLISICFICYLVGLIFCSQGGMYILQLFDNYAATYSLLIIGLVECLALSWVYGVDRFLKDIQSMLGHRPHIMWAYAWKFVSPFVLLAIMIFTWADFKPTVYGQYEFPKWSDALGWLISFSSVLAIPVIMVYKIIQYKRNNGTSVFESMKSLAKTDPDWGPVRKEHRATRQALDCLPAEQMESMLPLTGGNTDTANALLQKYDAHV